MTLVSCALICVFTPVHTRSHLILWLTIHRKRLVILALASSLLLQTSCVKGSHDILTSRNSVLPRVYIDTPIHNASVKFPALGISGWAAHPSGIRLVAIYVDRKYAAEATLGGSRPDVVAMFHEYQPANVSEWVLSLNLSPFQPGWHSLTAKAESNAGIDGDSVTIAVAMAK